MNLQFSPQNTLKGIIMLKGLITKPVIKYIAFHPLLENLRGQPDLVLYSILSIIQAL